MKTRGASVAAGGRFVWLASYPKSGNTWTRLALASLRSGGAAVDINRLDADGEGIASLRTHFDRMADAESGDLSADEILTARPYVFRRRAREFSGVRLVKAHEAYIATPAGEWLFPDDVTESAVYIVRDPRDVAPSFATHRGTSIDEAIRLMNSPAAVLAASVRSGRPQLPQPLLTWSGHVESWLTRPAFPVFVLRYEDMLGDPVASLLKVAGHLGWQVTRGAALAASEATRFDTLRAAEERDGFRERPRTTERFFRRGVAEGWRAELSAGQVAQIEDCHGAMMQRLGYL